MKNIRALLFDFGGTLDGNGIHWLERTYQFITKHHPEITREAFDTADKAAVAAFALGDTSVVDPQYQIGSMVPVVGMASDGAAARCTLRETSDAIAAGIYQRLGLRAELKDRYVESFCQDVAASLEENRRWLETLHGTYQLGVISNNFGNTRGWCDEYGLSPLLDVIVDSTAFGAAKPDARIFQHALSELGVAAAEAVYVGDSFVPDMMGAKAVGMWTAWLIGNETKTCPDASMVDVQLRHLHELVAFLDA